MHQFIYFFGRFWRGLWHLMGGARPLSDPRLRARCYCSCCYWKIKIFSYLSCYRMLSLKVNEPHERIQFKILFLAYKVLKTYPAVYLRILLTIQPASRIRSSSAVTLLGSLLLLLLCFTYMDVLFLTILLSYIEFCLSKFVSQLVSLLVLLLCDPLLIFSSARFHIWTMHCVITKYVTLANFGPRKTANINDKNFSVCMSQTTH
jgi:hypothetical protein